MVPLRVSQILTVPSSELVTIHLPSQWKATPVMLPVWPSKVSRGFGLVDLMSKSLTVWWPAAARKRLSGEMHKRLTCESGCWIVREQMPERASQNLERSIARGQSTLEPREGGRRGGRGEDGREVAGGLPYRVVVASCEAEVSSRVAPLRRTERGQSPRSGPEIAYRCRE